MANSNPEVRLIVLPENYFEYLVFVFETHCKQGLEPDELAMASELWKRVRNAPKVDFSDLGKVKMENLSPTQVAVSLEHEGGVCTPAETVIES
jgi:hypothetical protein